eukprot:CAMPEP_0194084310 /NCGR_PEP_ID=MMETSP0149-20130528/12764_1 /TAXON_ID=122233 /ORGANISM="Chaetoceros debilis, Strain MM31A-1" /LENGTH=325 /DNA_ID=CAMNT_0038766941 /DNA_START=423 /DNA_END=1397 /DNA_ORIENTATION=-
MRLSYFICLFSALAEASDTRAPRPFGVKSSLTHSDNTAKHRSHNHNLLDIPRGGGLPAKEANLVAPSPIKVLGSGEGILKSITRGGGPLGYLLALFKDDKRQPYLISLILSLVYLYFFLNKEVDCLSYSDGFCVTNFVDGKCPHSGNSHLWSFHEDVIFTIIGIALPFTKYGAKDLTTANRIAIPGIIIAHGILHWWLSSHNCAPGPANIGSATTLYSIFVVALTGIIFLAFSNFIETGTKIPKIIAMIAAISFAIIKLTVDSGNGNAIAALFMASHLLVSFVGAFYPGRTATKLTGQTFIAPVIVSLTEYLKCDFLASVGGHFW